MKKYLLKFLNDKSFDTLQAALAKADREEAFRMAHTLKGVSQNLGLASLFTSSDALTEALRNGISKDAGALFDKVEADYRAAVFFLLCISKFFHSLIHGNTHCVHLRHTHKYCAVGYGIFCYETVSARMQVRFLIKWKQITGRQLRQSLHCRQNK